jgi:hypothetical protein
MSKKPEAQNSLAKTELDKAEKQLDAFEQNIKDLTLDRMNTAPKQDVEPQTKLSQAEIEKSKEIYLKPVRSISSKEKFNEDYRKEYTFSTEYVRFIAEHKELIGETIEMWTKPYPGMPAEEWKIPTGKPIWAPRHVAEQLSSRKYHRLKMDQSVSTGADGNGQYYGTMVADTTVQRLDAIPVSSSKSIFMGAKSF